MKQNINILLKKCENNNLEDLKGLKTLTEYSNNMQDVFKNIEEYNPGRICNVLIVFDDMIADMISNKNLNAIIYQRQKSSLFISFLLLLSHYFTSQYQKMLN